MYIHPSIYTYIQTYIHIHIHTHTYIHTCMHTHTYIHTYIEVLRKDNYRDRQGVRHAFAGVLGGKQEEGLGRVKDRGMYLALND